MGFILGRAGVRMRGMSEYAVPSVGRSWRLLPFVVADVLLLAVAVVVVVRTPAPMVGWQAGLCAGCVALAAWFGCWPMLMDHQAAVKLAEQQGLAGTLEQIRNLEGVARQIQIATGQWQTVHEHANKVSQSAGELVDRMTKEGKAFAEAMQRANDTERAHLRLEVEKLRRSEGEWLQVVVRMLDHVYALYHAGVRSGRPALIEQLTHFQMACRDVVRRMGLVPYVAEAGEAFEARIHQLVDEKAMAAAGAKVAETVACGFTYQGQLLRPALVTLQGGQDGAKAAEVGAEGGDGREAGGAAEGTAGSGIGGSVAGSGTGREAASESGEDPGESAQEQLGLS